MYVNEFNHATRRAKCLAYGLLAVAAMTFTFECGRQRGFVEARQHGHESAEQAAATMQFIDEISRTRSALAGPESS